MIEKKICTADLRPGMYVSRLDRPWLETPFLFQGFLIRDKAETGELARLCRHVYIDVERGEAVDHSLIDPPLATAHALAKAADHASIKPVYTDTATLDEEIQQARVVYRHATDTINTIMEDVRSGRNISMAGVKEVATGMIGSILRNPDAILWLSKLKNRDSYTYTHALNACSLAIAFGRHLGLPVADLEHLAVGALLFDIGKMRLPEELLNKPGRLTAAEFAAMQLHVEYSVEQMQKIHGISRVSIDIAQSHHERYDGSGYPHKLIGDRTPVFARIAAIVDCYDAITSERPYARALSPHEAIRSLYEWRNVDFQDELVEQFIQCLGVYPIGTLVELSDGEVGIVLSQNRLRRLRPKVLMILDREKIAFSAPPVIDLMMQTGEPSGMSLEIVATLAPGTYGIDPCEFYL